MNYELKNPPTTCEHNTVSNVKLQPEGSMHYASAHCDDCGKSIWLKHPKTIEREKETARRIKALQSLPLSEWEKGFVASIAAQKKLSPKQLECLDKIWKEKQ